MKMRGMRGTAVCMAMAAWLALTGGETRAENGHDVEWRHYGGDRFSSRYCPTDALTRENVSKLAVAWRFNLDDADALTEEKGEKSRDLVSTPLMIGGKLYFTSGLSLLVCADPETGEILWHFDPRAYDRPKGPHGGLRSRGVEYWTDGKGDERIILATGGMQLFALDANTGKKCDGFGEEEGGWTDLAKHLDTEDYARNQIAMNAPAIVCRDTVIVGSIINDFGSTQAMPPGHVRGFDVRTGKFKWIFHSIPQEGDFGNETWENDSWKYTGNTNVWSMMSADEELGMVYLPFGTPTDDHYGGHRHGDNLFAECLVALDADTGKRVWHFQAVHHGIWDYDFPCAPNLVDVTVDGKKIKAVAQVSKQAFTYVFNRETGEPLWPIEERPVPPSRVPGEKAAATQPFPTKPPAFDLQGMTEETVIDLTPELKAEAMEILKDYEIGPLFTPPIFAGQDNLQGMIQLPGMTGGANWPGAAVDPETGILYVVSYTRPNMMSLREGGRRSDLAYNRGGMGGPKGPRGLPLTRPPWGRITAIDLNRGDFAWQIPHGDSYRDHPVIQELNPGPLGSSYSSGLAGPGTLVTKNLLFANQAEPDGTGWLRAFDKATGEIIHELKVDNAPVNPPMAYERKGKPYIIFAAAGRGSAKELIAFSISE